MAAGHHIFARSFVPPPAFRIPAVLPVCAYNLFTISAGLALFEEFVLFAGKAKVVRVCFAIGTYDAAASGTSEPVAGHMFAGLFTELVPLLIFVGGVHSSRLQYGGLST